MTDKQSYILGFGLSILLTFLAAGGYWLHAFTAHTFPTHEMLRIIFVALAVAQLGVQLVFFLHVGKERSAHWRVIALGFALFAVAVLVGGTLWIMSNLNHYMHSTKTTFEPGHVDPAHEN